MFVLCARVASAQSATPTPPPSNEIHFMPRYDFHLTAEHLSGDDESFVWDANFGGDLDVVDYGKGRASFVANYQVILGDEIRRFDPNQGNYILSGSSSLREGPYEIAGVFYHQSRHLSDRPNRVAVAWNMVGGRVRRGYVLGPTHLDAHVDVRGTVAKAFVDYNWEVDGGVRSDVHVHKHVGVLLAGNLRRLGVDGSQNRGDQTGYRAEAGVRLLGDVGAMEFFIAAERRIDPYPLEFGTAYWTTVGFRLVTR